MVSKRKLSKAEASGENGKADLPTRSSGIVLCGDPLGEAVAPRQAEGQNDSFGDANY